ncbi:MAG: hydrogenase maturation protease [Candidatus Odinarchaeota archaeon]|nr:hydrogenase maturation protease [Candidatus Odinarchaeota archaeon]RKY70230.1 MAG: hypothetical protein DRQ24_09615 [Candidatus Latescibacterota bacterium]
MKILIVGLGNPILSDDAIGLHVVRKINKYIQSSPLPKEHQIDIIEESANSLELVEKFLGYDKVVIVDSLKTNKLAVGEIAKLTPKSFEKANTRNVSNPHDVDFYSAIKVLKEIFGKDITGDITIYGIEVRNIHEFGEKLSPELIEKIDIYAKLIMEDIKKSVLK